MVGMFLCSTKESDSGFAEGFICSSDEERFTLKSNLWTEKAFLTGFKHRPLGFSFSPKEREVFVSAL